LVQILDVVELWLLRLGSLGSEIQIALDGLGHELLDVSSTFDLHCYRVALFTVFGLRLDFEGRCRAASENHFFQPVVCMDLFGRLGSLKLLGLSPLQFLGLSFNE